MKDKAQLIREEIESRIEQCYRCLAQDLLEIERKETNCCLQQYKELLQFIDSLPEEPNVKNEDSSDECPCCGWALDSDGCCGSCGYGRK